MNRTFKGLLITSLFVSCEHELPINTVENTESEFSIPTSALSTTFFKKYEQGSSKGESVIKTYDGGYAFAGSCGDIMDPDMYLVKVDRYGNLQWENCIHGNTQLDKCIRQTIDSGFIIISSQEPQGNTKLTKVDKSGKLQWQKFYSNFYFAYSIALASDNGYVTTGFMYNISYKQAVVKLSISGDILWAKMLDTNISCSSIERTTDNGFIIAGSIFEKNSNVDLLILKIDAQGNTQWQSTFGGQYEDRGKHAIQTSDGGYVAVGSNSKSSDNTIRQVYIVKVTSQGKYQWIRGNSPSNYAYGRRIRETPDHGFAIAGSTYNEATLIRASSNGSFQWRKRYPFMVLQSIQDVIVESDGGYVFTGDSYGNDSVICFASLVRTNAQGNF